MFAVLYHEREVCPADKEVFMFEKDFFETGRKSSFRYDDDFLSDSVTRTWTPQALECYGLNCDCSKCSITKGNYSFECKMPEVLKKLVQNVGLPCSAA